MKMLDEFKEFAMKGNVVDMAVGVVIGGAFGKIVTSFLNDILMPPLGMLTGGVDFTDHRLMLKAAESGAKAVTVNYGAFITVVVDFAVVAFAVFMLVKGMHALKHDAPHWAGWAALLGEALQRSADMTDQITLNVLVYDRGFACEPLPFCDLC